MSFYCAHMPVCMGVMRNILAVGFQEATTATYSIVMYNLKDKGELTLKNALTDDKRTIDVLFGIEMFKKN